MAKVDPVGTTMLIAAHKSAAMPADPLYLPVHVGHALADRDLGYQHDDEGENISARNRSYCELTAVYWAWKNLDSESIGLSHYRRYFAGSAEGPAGTGVLSGDEARELMGRFDLVVGASRNYWIETVDSHYRNGHHGGDLDVLREAVYELSPECRSAYDRVFGGRRLSLYNMFLMRGQHFPGYADWLFRILQAVEETIDLSGRTAYQQRAFGYLGERLLNVWAAAHSEQLSVGTRRVVNTEGEPKVAKAVKLVKRKFRGRQD